jgi:hypothetical protein
MFNVSSMFIGRGRMIDPREADVTDGLEDGRVALNLYSLNMNSMP